MDPFMEQLDKAEDCIAVIAHHSLTHSLNHSFIHSINHSVNHSLDQSNNKRPAAITFRH